MNKRFSFGIGMVMTACFLGVVLFHSFHTPSMPAVDTGQALPHEASVILKGTIRDPGTQEISRYGFRWGTSQDLTEEKICSGSIQAKEAYSAAISGLIGGHTYYYQAYAINASGTGYGEILKFTAPANEPPTVSIQKPAHGFSVVQGETISIAAGAHDDHHVPSVELYINNTAIICKSAKMLEYAWNTENEPPGEYEVKVTATDGSQTAQHVVSIIIHEKPAPKPVQIASSIPSPASSNTFPQPASRSKESWDQSKYPLLSIAKGSYGRFPYRDVSGGRIEIDPAWIADNIVTITLPGINRKVQVHKEAKDAFLQAFTYIKNGTATIDGKTVPLVNLVHTMDGTFVPRHINRDKSRSLSNHSWGIAIDINAADHYRYVNPSSEPFDPNLILWERAFRPAGFSWGNSYNDAMHFELLN